MDLEAKKRRHLVWSIIYPLLIYWAVEIVVLVGASVIVSFMTYAEMFPQLMAEENVMEQSKMLYYQVMEWTLQNGYYLQMLINLITIPLLYLFFRRDKKTELRLGTEVPYRHATVMEYLLLAIVAFGATIGGNLLIAASGLMEADSGYQQATELLYSASLPVQLIGTVLIGPLCEELIYRGLIYKRLRAAISPMQAMVISSLLFGIAHGNLVQLLYAFVLGLLMAYVYEKYHSFLAPFLFHAVGNAIAVLMTETGIFEFMYSGKIMMVISGILGVAVVVLGGRMIREIHLEPKNPESKIEM